MFSYNLCCFFRFGSATLYDLEVARATAEGNSRCGPSSSASVPPEPFLLQRLATFQFEDQPDI